MNALLIDENGTIKSVPLTTTVYVESERFHRVAEFLNIWSIKTATRKEQKKRGVKKP